jgi:hypothetical protein
MSYDEANWTRTIIGLGILFFCISIMAELAEHKIETKRSLERIEALLMNRRSD